MCAPLESLYYFLRYFLFGVHKVQDEAHSELSFTIEKAHAKDLQTPLRILEGPGVQGCIHLERLKKKKRLKALNPMCSTNLFDKAIFLQ